MKPHKPPFHLKELKIEVTHDCKLKCVHCSSMSTEVSSKTMTWSKCRNIIDEATEMGVEKVSFSGGEPLLWSNLCDAVSLSKKNGMQVSVYTTGNTPHALQELERLHAAGLNKIMFSIFSSDEANHEKVTCVKGSFNISLGAVKKAVELNLDVEFHFVPLASNFMDIEKIVKMATSEGVDRVSILRLVPQGRAIHEQHNLLSHEQNILLRGKILELRELGYNIRTGSPYNFLILKEKPACCSGIDRLTIGPDLKIYPCDAFKHISPEMVNANSAFSSLKDHSLYDCWKKSQYLKTVREYLTTPFADACKKCNYLEKCLSGCVAQKIHYNSPSLKCPDPMCIMQRYDLASSRLAADKNI
jgi:radical SAM protein with 4Fe4S-binding SPASM domain